MFHLEAKHILAPSDFSADAHKAIELAVEAAHGTAEVTVLHVAPPLSGVAAADPAILWETIADDDREMRLREAFEHHFPKGEQNRLKFVVRFGVPAEEISAYAKDHGTDLIVLSSHGHTGLKRLLIGSVTEKVVRYAHCPVLVLRH